MVKYKVNLKFKENGKSLNTLSEEEKEAIRKAMNKE